MSMTRYHVLHETHYDYQQPVRESHQLMRLQPRELPWQHCVEHRLRVSPEPARSRVFFDRFGNRVTALHFEDAHESLHVRSECWVEMRERGMPQMYASPPWEEVREALRYRAGQPLAPDLLDASAFLFESTDVRIKRVFAEYAAASFAPRQPLLACCHDLMQRIFEEFTFDPEATDVTTPVLEVFEKKRGVCQDFAHFMIACLRSLGLPARYVSGYLLTRPPPGRKRLIGADATHAWVSVFVPGSGWFDLDPTNAVWTDTEHITIGWGRDFSDISPLRGVILGGGIHEPEISVTVVPEHEFAELYGAANLPGFETPGAR